MENCILWIALLVTLNNVKPWIIKERLFFDAEICVCVCMCLRAQRYSNIICTIDRTMQTGFVGCADCALSTRGGFRERANADYYRRNIQRTYQLRWWFWTLYSVIRIFYSLKTWIFHERKSRSIVPTICFFESHLDARYRYVNHCMDIARHIELGCSRSTWGETKDGNRVWECREGWRAFMVEVRRRAKAAGKRRVAVVRKFDILTARLTSLSSWERWISVTRYRRVSRGFTLLQIDVWKNIILPALKAMSGYTRLQRAIAVGKLFSTKAIYIFYKMLQHTGLNG